MTQQKLEDAKRKAKIMAKFIIQFKKDSHKKTMAEIHYTIFTPFYIKVYDKISNNIIKFKEKVIRKTLTDVLMKIKNL